MSQRMSRLLRLSAMSLALLMVFVGAFSCKTRLNQRKKAGAGQGSEWIVERSVTFTRNADRTEGVLRFQTKEPLLCEIEYWSRDPKVPPSEDNPASQPCSNTQAATSFEETLKSLNSETSYAFRLLLWRPGQSKAQAKPFRIDEGGESGNIVTGDVVIARVVFPQRTAEIYTHELSGKVTVAELRRPLMRSIGCNNAALKADYPYAEASDNKLELASTEGFTRFQTKPHPYYANRFIQTYAAINLGSSWDWSYTWEGKVDQFKVKPPAYLSRISMESGEKFRMQNFKLTGDAPKFNLAPNAPLVFEWVPKNLASTSYLTVLFEGVKSNHVVHCTFAANTGKGTVPENFVDAMPADNYYLTTILESHQIRFEPGSSAPTWLISSNDWRYAQVTKP